MFMQSKAPSEEWLAAECSTCGRQYVWCMCGAFDAYEGTDDEDAEAMADLWAEV